MYYNKGSGQSMLSLTSKKAQNSRKPRSLQPYLKWHDFTMPSLIHNKQRTSPTPPSSTQPSTSTFPNTLLLLQHRPPFPPCPSSPSLDHADDNDSFRLQLNRPMNRQHIHSSLRDRICSRARRGLGFRIGESPGRMSCS